MSPGDRAHVEFELSRDKRIRHVQRIGQRGRLTGPIHGQKSVDMTFCSWVFRSHKTFGGGVISNAALSEKPLSCRRCAEVMRVEINTLLRKLEPGDIEKLLEQIL